MKYTLKIKSKTYSMFTENVSVHSNCCYNTMLWTSKQDKFIFTVLKSVLTRNFGSIITIFLKKIIILREDSLGWNINKISSEN